MFNDAEVVAATTSVCGEPTQVVHIRLEDAHGHDRELTIGVEAAAELAGQLLAAAA